jgi:hypothetical protein
VPVDALRTPVVRVEPAETVTAEAPPPAPTVATPPAASGAATGAPVGGLTDRSISLGWTLWGDAFL